MALINFPSSPVVNQVYKHEEGTSLEKAFIFKAGETGASDGYWSGFPTTGFGPASAVEIDAGTDNIKYIAPDQLELSKYNHVYKPPAGVSFTTYSSIAPTGSLACDASERLITSWQELYDAIGDTYATTGGVAAPTVGYFRLPPSEIGGLGLYERGVGVTNGPVGTYQEDVFKEHTHPASNANALAQAAGTNGYRANSLDGNITLDVDGNPLESRGDATETRPRSLTVLKCIWTGK